MDFGLLLHTATPVTRVVVGTSLVLALAVSVRLVSDQALVYIPSRIVQGEVWRIFTSMFYVGSFSGSVIVGCIVHQSSSLWLETVYYPSSLAYAWRLLLLGVVILVGSTLMGIRQPSFAILSALEYICTRCHEQQVLWFGLPISSGILPFHQLFSAYLFQDSNTAKGHMLGIFLGHLILVLDDVIPQWTRRRVLGLPSEKAAMSQL